MDLILNIDAAVEGASVSIAKDGKETGSLQTVESKDSAAWLHVAIRDLLKQQQVGIAELNAVAVSSGPGSYTGLRVGMSTAKGLCYALSIPLITVNTLEMMAFAARKKTSTVLCPMIDARRMEVFTAIFNSDLGLISPPCSMVLDTGSFSEELDTEPITFFGNGSGKWQKVCEHRNAVFLDVKSSASDLAELSYKRFELNEFADLAYAEPYYGKAFYSPPPKPSV